MFFSTCPPSSGKRSAAPLTLALEQTLLLGVLVLPKDNHRVSSVPQPQHCPRSPLLADILLSCAFPWITSSYVSGTSIIRVKNLYLYMQLAAYFWLCGPYHQGSVAPQMLAWWQFCRISQICLVDSCSEGHRKKEALGRTLYRTSLLLRFPAVSKTS